MCGTGLGISYALNRHKHIRSTARVVSIEDAHFAKLHNDPMCSCLVEDKLHLKMLKKLLMNIFIQNTRVVVTKLELIN
ncbi:RpiB/LacA/LacB family sugar-phosphate isomerase [Mycoplasmopsis cynos]|uniref:RpiB/LacA/LacB family sugar-phosphate isomerase n=1 Tax=Mycoplasmopsis cynos TaxID=171284 RepID=UPI003A5C7856